MTEGYLILIIVVKVICILAPLYSIDSVQTLSFRFYCLFQNQSLTTANILYPSLFFLYFRG